MRYQESFTLNATGPNRSVRILIVGGGYAGTRLARMLDADAEVTLVEQRDRFVHNVASIRAIVDPDLGARATLPYDRLLARGRVLRGTVTGLSAGGVALAGGDILTADIVVLAPGSSYAAPFKPDAGEDAAAHLARLTAIGRRVATARSIAIVGAGPVGIELAGEIASDHRDKTITLISADPQLMPAYRPALGRKLERDLRALGVHIRFGERARDLPVIHGPFGPAAVTLQRGTTIQADLIFPALGMVPNTGFLASLPGALRPDDRIDVGPRLALSKYPNVFAIGDAAGTEDAPTIGSVERQIAYLSKLIRRMVAGGVLADAKVYAPAATQALVVPVGPDRGASQLPPGLVLGGWATSRIKGRHLFLGTVRKNLGLTAREIMNSQPASEETGHAHTAR